MRRWKSKPHVFVKFADHAFYCLKKSGLKEEEIVVISDRLCLWIAKKEDEDEESAREKGHREEREASNWDKLID